MNDYLMARVNNIVYKDTLNTEISKSDISLLNSLPTKEVISTLRGIFDKEHDDVLNSRAYNAILSIRNFDKVQFLIDIFDGASIDWQIAHCKSFAQFH